MPKHRGPILEHQTSTLASLSDFSMENAINSSNFAVLFGRETASTAAGDGRSWVGAWKQAFLASEAAWGEAIIFEISHHLVSFSLTRLGRGQ